MPFLLAKPTPRNMKFGSDRFSMFNKQRDIPRSTDAAVKVELRMGAVAWGLWPTLRFPSPLIKPNVPISGIRLSDWFHREAHGEQPNRTRLRHGASLSFALRYSFL